MQMKVDGHIMLPLW